MSDEKIRVQEYGAFSYWPSSIHAAIEIAEQIIARNGCGNIQLKRRGCPWVVTHRFEKHTGIIDAGDGNE